MSDMKTLPPLVDALSGKRALKPSSPKVRIVVDQQIIDNSTKRDSSHCMIAEAIKRTLPDARSIAVDLSTIRFTDPKQNLRYIYLTPRPGQIALIEFDRGNKPEPFSILLSRAARIVRTSPHGPRDKNTTQAEKNNKSRAINEKINAQDLNSPHKPPADEAKRVAVAAADPNANLGPPIAVPGSGRDHVPTIVGGPAIPRGNLGKVRRFGLKGLVE